MQQPDKNLDLDQTRHSLYQYDIMQPLTTWGRAASDTVQPLISSTNVIMLRDSQLMGLCHLLLQSRVYGIVQICVSEQCFGIIYHINRRRKIETCRPSNPICPFQTSHINLGVSAMSKSGESRIGWLVLSLISAAANKAKCSVSWQQRCVHDT